jgi:hypothetical protein
MCAYAEQDILVEEYEYPAYGNTLRPWCEDFKTSGGSTHFSWPELNGRGSASSPPYGNLHYDNGGWGMIDFRLTNGLEAARTIYDRGGILLSGGYRCPHGNAEIKNAVKNSDHTHGRAADMYSADHGGKNWTLTECNILRDAALATVPAPMQVLACTEYTDKHLHAAW